MFLFNSAAVDPVVSFFFHRSANSVGCFTIKLGWNNTSFPVEIIPIRTSASQRFHAPTTRIPAEAEDCADYVSASAAVILDSRVGVGSWSPVISLALSAQLADDSAVSSSFCAREDVSSVCGFVESFSTAAVNFMMSATKPKQYS